MNTNCNTFTIFKYYEQAYLNKWQVQVVEKKTQKKQFAFCHLYLFMQLCL